jgi:putative ABC transport system ATP-binding protein
MTDGAVVDLLDVSKTYRRGDGAAVPAVQDVTLTIAGGSAVALTGASGSGKSTLLHLLGAVDRPDTGRIEVDGVDIAALRRRRLPEYRRSVGFVFQRYNLLPALTALDNVLAPVLPYRVGYDKDTRGRELLEQVGLAGREDALPSRLSGGQQQRVAIARALIGSPRLLLADEPTGNLDSRTGAEILDLILQLRETSRMTVIVATHDSSVSARLGRVIRLKDGAVVEDHDLTTTSVTTAHLTGLG